MVVLMLFVVVMVFVVPVHMCINMVFVGMFVVVIVVVGGLLMFMVMLVMLMLLMIVMMMLMTMLMHVLVFFNTQCNHPRMCAGDAAFHAALEVISHIRNSQ